MDVYEAIQTLLAVRSYADKPISDETVRKILEAGRLTASASNKQPWHFVVVQDPATLRALGETAKNNGPYIAQAPLAIVVVIDSETARFGVSDASRAIQDMMLTAWAEGIGSNWVGFSGMLDGVNQVLGIPTDKTVLAVIPFGYPTDSIGKGKKERKPLAEIAHHERWDQPFA